MRQKSGHYQRPGEGSESRKFWKRCIEPTVCAEISAIVRPFLVSANTRPRPVSHVRGDRIAEKLNGGID
jgi:hypothetical protein